MSVSTRRSGASTDERAPGSGPSRTARPPSPSYDRRRVGTAHSNAVGPRRPGRRAPPRAAATQQLRARGEHLEYVRPRVRVLDDRGPRLRHRHRGPQRRAHLDDDVPDEHRQPELHRRAQPVRARRRNAGAPTRGNVVSDRGEPRRRGRSDLHPRAQLVVALARHDAARALAWRAVRGGGDDLGDFRPRRRRAHRLAPNHLRVLREHDVRGREDRAADRVRGPRPCERHLPLMDRAAHRHRARGERGDLRPLPAALQPGVPRQARTVRPQDCRSLRRRRLHRVGRGHHDNLADADHRAGDARRKRCRLRVLRLDGLVHALPDQPQRWHGAHD